jgi:uncharacterized protein with ACT and thioredoxin-like domain
MIFPLKSFSQTKPDTSNVKNEKVVSFDDFDISLVRLIATPERYDGKIIQVKGYLNLEFEGNAIYLHKEDYSKSLVNNAFWVDFSKEISEKKNLDNYNRRYVIIIGTFDMKSHGHMGLFGGAIKNITRLDLWDFNNK